MHPKYIERFWAKVDKSAGPDACWPWTGTRSVTGYGVMRLELDGVFSTQKVHRLAFLLAHGEWPEPLCRHLCSSALCVNPAHLEAGNDQQNMADKLAAGRQPRGADHWLSKKASSVRGKRATRSGAGHWAAALDEHKVRAIRVLIESGVALHAIARTFGVSPQTIRAIKDGRTWRHVP